MLGTGSAESSSDDSNQAKDRALLLRSPDLATDAAYVDVGNVNRESVLIKNGNDVLPIRVNIVKGPLVDAELPFRFLTKLANAGPMEAIRNRTVLIRGYEDIRQRFCRRRIMDHKNRLHRSTNGFIHVLTHNTVLLRWLSWYAQYFQVEAQGALDRLGS